MSAEPSQDELDLDAIREACDGAAVGPWSSGASYEVWRRYEWGARRIATVAEVPNDTENATARYWTVEFIAGARQWVPALVVELERVRGERDALHLDSFTRPHVVNAALNAWRGHRDDDVVAMREALRAAHSASRVSLPLEEK